LHSKTGHFPCRIVCLSAESADILFRLGAGKRIAGVSVFAALPVGAERIPRVSGFDSANLDRIRQLEPDLIIAYSDVQAKLVEALVRDGFTILATNQRTLEEIAETIELLGRMVGRGEGGEKLANEFRAGCRGGLRPPFAADIAGDGHRPPLQQGLPRVYFEEWNNPLVSGICWVSELIEIAGGRDIFPEFRACKKAEQRVVSAEEVARRDPEIIIASWCGKKADLESIRSRPGWAKIKAVRDGQVHEMDSSIILQPGPVLLEGLAELKRLVAKARQTAYANAGSGRHDDGP